MDNPGAIRVKGRYIPQDTDRAGQVFGMMGYIHAWIYAVLLPCSLYAVDHYFFSPLSVFLIGMFVVHGCALVADGLRHSEAPWARRGIMLFWASTLGWAAFGAIASLL